MRARTGFLLVFAFFTSTLLPSSIWSQTVNVNFTNSDNGVASQDGNGILGSGTFWTRLTGGNTLTNLVDDLGVPTSVSIADETDPTMFGIYTETRRPNLIQNFGFISAGVPNQFGPTLRVSNLLPNTNYQVAIYTARITTSQTGSETSVTVNGQNRVGIATDASYVSLPGVEGFDYLRFTVNSGLTGEISVIGTLRGLCGIQISNIVQDDPTQDLTSKIAKLKRKIKKAKKKSDRRKAKRLLKKMRKLRAQL